MALLWMPGYQAARPVVLQLGPSKVNGSFPKICWILGLGISDAAVAKWHTMVAHDKGTWWWHFSIPQCPVLPSRFLVKMPLLELCFWVFFGYLFCSGYLFSALTVWSKRLPAERAEKYLGCANMNKPG